MCRWNLMVIAPPLIVTEEQLRVGIRAIDQALEIADRYAATGDL
jgi:4-aminobutyrate aminotransferase-like enzyme